MNENNTFNEQDAELSHNAVSLYGADSGEDFPVLKAFQQYIDAEQAKARKRLVTLGIFFSALMFAVIAVFVVLLITVSERNQALNDRLVEFAMKDRDRSPAAPVVVQPSNNDNSAMLELTRKLEDMQRQLTENQRKLEEKNQSQTIAEKPKQPTPQEIEIQRLKALLDVEKQKAAAEKERKHQEEIEAYRRKHYPELYQDDYEDDEEYLPRRKTRRSPSARKASAARKQKQFGAISYFDDDDDEIEEDLDIEDDVPAAKDPAAKEKEVPATKAKETDTAKETAAKTEAENKYSIPVDSRKSSISWRIPD